MSETLLYIHKVASRNFGQKSLIDDEYYDIVSECSQVRRIEYRLSRSVDFDPREVGGHLQ